MWIADLLNTKDLRYERKFYVNSMIKSNIEAILKNHPSMFIEVYPERFVNNIYFDEPNMSHYWDNVHGVSRRIKIRIRWYGELFKEVSNPILEFKIKNNSVGSKISFTLEKFVVNDNLTIDTIKNLFYKLQIPDNLRHYLLSLDFALMNRYHRKYLQSRDSHFRVTIDSDLEFIKLLSWKNNFLHKVDSPITTIIELKYDEKYDNETSYVTKYFPFRMTKSSKYVLGVQQIW